MEDPVIEVKAIKLGLLGDSTVGKTAICRSLLNLDFCSDMLSTIGCDKLETKFSTKNGKQIKLCLLDSAGQERFRSMAFTALKAVHGLILVFDVSLRLIHENFDNPCLVLFGNKIDKDKSEWKVTPEEIEKLVEDNKLTYFETSAKTKKGITEGFDYIVNIAYDKVETKKKVNNNNNIKLKNDNNNNKEEKKKKCCSGNK